MPRLFERPNSPYWYAEITVGGKLVRISTQVPRGRTTRKRAEQVAAEREQEINRVEASVSLKDAVVRFLKDSKGVKKDSTIYLYTRKLASVIHTRKGTMLSDINTEWLRSYVSARKLKTTDIQIRMELIVLSGCLGHAHDVGLEGAPEINPVRFFNRKALKRSVPRPRWLTPEEVKRLMAAASEGFWKPFLTLLLETGMRKEEALGLTWDEVDIDRRIIQLDWKREKTGRGRTIPLSDAALAVVESRPRYPKVPYVFTNPRTRTRYKSIDTPWVKLRERARVPRARMHDLRHTFATWTRQMGMSREDRKDIVGHVDDKTHGGYANASLETLIESINKFSPSRFLSD